MINVTKELIDNTYDALTIMRLFSQRLGDGEVGDIEAGEMSWLLGSAKKRLEPVLDLLERIETARELGRSAPMDFALAKEISDLQDRWDALKAKLEGSA